MKYQLFQINAGKEKILLDTDNARLVKAIFDRDAKQRIRIDGKTLLIYQAEDWVHGKAIKEYKEKIKASGCNLPKKGNRKAVVQLDSSGNEIACYKSIVEAAEANYCSYPTVANICNGRKTMLGLHFKWGEKAQ